MSYSGIYVHSAPWSVGSQGRSNVSHGCLNVSPSNAVWFYDNTKRGDIVEVINTVGSTLPGTDGLGDWNIRGSSGRPATQASDVTLRRATFGVILVALRCVGTTTSSAPLVDRS